MDPNVTLKELLDITRTLLSGHDVSDVEDQAHALAMHVEALDHWLRAGGFLPRRWQGQPAQQPATLRLELSPEDVKELLRGLFVAGDEGQALDEARAQALFTRLEGLLPAPWLFHRRGANPRPSHPEGES